MKIYKLTDKPLCTKMYLSMKYKFIHNVFHTSKFLPQNVFTSSPLFLHSLL